MPRLPISLPDRCGPAAPSTECDLPQRGDNVVIAQVFGATVTTVTALAVAATLRKA